MDDDDDDEDEEEEATDELELRRFILTKCVLFVLLVLLALSALARAADGARDDDLPAKADVFITRIATRSRKKNLPNKESLARLDLRPATCEIF